MAGWKVDWLAGLVDGWMGGWIDLWMADGWMFPLNFRSILSGQFSMFTCFPNLVPMRMLKLKHHIILQASIKQREREENTVTVSLCVCGSDPGHDE